jgi:hypothetical protein
MYKYDPTLFDGVILPDGMDKTIMVNQIIRQSGDLFPYYQVPPEVKTAITEWFTRRKDNFAKLWQGFTAEYNPIENYDRHEDSTETPDITHTLTNSGEDSSTNEADVQGYNATDYTPNSRTISSGTSSTNGTDKESGTRTFTSHIHGNIGVTTSAQMLEGELALRRSLDIYSLIAEEFETDNLIQVY